MNRWNSTCDYTTKGTAVSCKRLSAHDLRH